MKRSASTSRSQQRRELAAWLVSPEGEAVLQAGNKLVRTLVSGWSRRGSKMLNITCGSGVFLALLWEQGFDVTGIDADPDLLDAARKLMDGRVDFYLGQPDHLPFDDNEFDYAVVTLGLEEATMQAVLEEALRVATRGVLVVFGNRWSLFGVSELLRSKPKRHAAPYNAAMGVSVGQLVRAVRELCPACKLVLRSVLAGPPCSWRTNAWLAPLNNACLMWPFGACACLRIEKTAEIPLTPLLLSVRAAKPKAETYATCSLGNSSQRETKPLPATQPGKKHHST